MTNDELSAFNRVTRIIEDLHIEFRRMATSQLVMLFWIIGNKINSSVQKTPSLQASKSGWRALLHETYGGYFTASSLISMQAFAAQHPTMQEAALIAAATDWDHIKILVDVPDDHTREQLTAQMLRMRMSAAALAEVKDSMQSDNAPAIRKTRKNQTSSLFRAEVRQNMNRANPLQANILHDPDFLSFFEMPGNAGKPGQEHHNPDAAEVLLLKAIELDIANYLYSFDYLVGIFTAQSGSYIGWELYQSFEAHKDLFADFQAFLERFSLFYETETGIGGVSVILKTFEPIQSLQQPSRRVKQPEIVEAEPIIWNPDDDIRVISRKIGDTLKTPLFQLLS